MEQSPLAVSAATQLTCHPSSKLTCNTLTVLITLWCCASYFRRTQDTTRRPAVGQLRTRAPHHRPPGGPARAAGAEGAAGGAQAGLTEPRGGRHTGGGGQQGIGGTGLPCYSAQRAYLPLAPELCK